MKQIPLTQGMVALVDDEDFEWLCGWKWQVNRPTGADPTYAIRRERHVIIAMHAFVMGEPPSPTLTVDHWNGDGLNNQRSNLRWATASQQAQNSRLHRDSNSGFKGVTFVRDWNRTAPWQARICLNRKPMFLGYFPTAEAAALAYNDAAMKHFGDFARLNHLPAPLFS